jgi:hypothetical protein
MLPLGRVGEEVLVVWARSVSRCRAFLHTNSLVVRVVVPRAGSNRLISVVSVVGGPWGGRVV